MSLLKGAVYITDDFNVINNIPLNNTKVIDLDEFGTLQGNDAFIGGTCLLPPVEAKIAEADNNEYLYDSIYQSHLLEPYQQQFIGALISYLYKGGNLIFYLPSEAYNNTKDKFLINMWALYGLHIGDMTSKDPNQTVCFYDEKCIIIWLNMVYSCNAISAKEYLFLLPEDVPVSNNQESLMILIDELNPFGLSINEKISTLEHFRKSIKGNIAANMVLGSVRS